MTERPLILLTNDDGIDAPGLAALRRAIEPLGRVEIAAPSGQRSAVSHAITVLKDMPYRAVRRDGKLWGHALDAMPADCVKLAVTYLLDRPPDLVLSGVNPGANLGNNILYSGTVAAAREAAMLGVPAIAVSVQRQTVEPSVGDLHFEPVAQYAARLARQVLRHGLPPGVILNVNAPNLPADRIEGIVVSRQGQTMFVDKMQPSKRNGSIHAFANVGDKLLRSDPEEKLCDDIVVENGKISVTPLHFDLTHEAFREQLSKWVDPPR